MCRRLVAMLAAIAVAACSTAPSVPSAGPASATASMSATQLMECLGGVPQATCDQVLPVALAAVAVSGWTPTHVWINSGNLCPQESCLFDPGHNFPYPIPPDGGQWATNAEIAFAQTDKHAGIQVAQVGSTLVPVLIGYRVPLLTWCSGTCPSTSTTEGPFRLELVLPHLQWKTGDQILGTGILSYAGSAPILVFGPSGGPVVFTFDEVSGDHRVAWASDAACQPRPINPATPFSRGMLKSGGVSGNEPDADWLRSFYADPQIRLPAGTWDVSAIAVFSEKEGCSGGTHTMKTTLRVTVGG